MHEIKVMKLAELKPASYNPRTISDEALAGLTESVKRFGLVQPIVVNRASGNVVGGHQRIKALEKLGVKEAQVVVVDLSESEEKALNVTMNNPAIEGTFTADLGGILDGLKLDFGADLFEGLRLDEIEIPLLDESPSEGLEPVERLSLTDRFVVPPFSVLDARQGYWQERKRAWLALGIQSELGRGGQDLKRRALVINKEMTPGWYEKKRSGMSDEEIIAEYEGGLLTSGTSIFDPVLCEIIYRWFCLPGGAILDPFAGGSVRGIVAAMLGRKYTGIDLRKEQIEANRKQADAILENPQTEKSPTDTDPDELTPVESVSLSMGKPCWLKRDDLFSFDGVQGGKARTCLFLAKQGNAQGLITAGSRSSPQVNIVAHVAKALGIPCRAHTPEGKLSPELKAAQAAGAEIVQHKAGYNNVIIARAHEDAAKQGWQEIPFGMECREAVEQTRRQVANIPVEATRLVVSVGSGMSLAGILWGLKDNGRSLPVVGIMVGADPVKRLDEYAPEGWREAVQLVKSDADYHAAIQASISDVLLDPHYEAKCLKYLEPGDCFWIVGIRQTAGKEFSLPVTLETPVPPQWIIGDSQNVETLAPGKYDLIFSCPPYHDLEQYSDDPADLSNMNYDNFLAAYRTIIADSVAMLNDDSFACFVVGDIRDKQGFYRNFVSNTITAFQDTGMKLYNDAVLITVLGSLPIRAGKHFEAGRKLGKTHQNVLVFIKGDPKKATEKIGAVAFDAQTPVLEANSPEGP